MIRINLLPNEYAVVQARKELQVVSGSIGSALAVCLILFSYVKHNQARDLEKKITDTEAQLSTYQAIVAQIESIEAEKKKMISKRDVIKNLNKSRLIYPVFFEDFLPIIPPDVWVTSIQISDGDQMKVALSCNALSNFALATWLTNLQQSKNFSAIDLGSIAYTTNDQGGTVLAFQLNFKYQHQGPFPLQES